MKVRSPESWHAFIDPALQVFLPAIVGHVPDETVRAITAFMDFCYFARRSLLIEDTLHEMDNALTRFHQECEIFCTLGIRTDFNLPHQHSLIHYRRSIQQFGAPNGLCSSMTENKYIKAVKEPWQRSNRYNALGQMLITSQRIDKLAATRLDYVECGLLPPPCRP